MGFSSELKNVSGKESTTSELASVSSASPLFYLYWQLGREAGLVARLMSQNDFLWGSYEDVLGTHCNAHTNNFVVLPPASKFNRLLAPLDLDMAFTRDTFIFKKEDGSFDEEKFTEWKTLESNGLKIALSGDELSTGAKPCLKFSTPEKEAFNLGLRDTLMKAFTDAFEGKEDLHPTPTNKAFQGAMYSIVKLALMLTSDEYA